MALSVAANFASLSEAHVAAGALRAAGFDAQVFDDHFGTMVWMEQLAIGGFRIVVPVEERADARAFLREVVQQAPRRRPSPREKGYGWRALALATGLTLGASVGWAVVGLKRRASYARGIGIGGMAIVALGMALGLAVALWLLGALFAELLHPGIGAG